MRSRSFAYARSEVNISSNACVRLAIVGRGDARDEDDNSASFSMDITDCESDGEGVGGPLLANSIDSRRAAIDAALVLCDGVSST